MIEELCAPTLQPFLDTSATFEEAQYIIFGAPLDKTASQRSGSRFAPTAIRQASLYMETYSLRTGLDWGDVGVADIGDMRSLDEVDGALESIEGVAREILGAEKKPVMLGGEHTVTLGALRASKPDLVVDFDAHLDLRHRLFGLELSHATFMRRALEELDHKLVVLGCRAFSKEEREFVETNKDRVEVVTAIDLLKEGADWGVEVVRSLMEGVSSAYLSIDVDVLDPAYAPAVGNPSPEGISVTMLLDIIAGVANTRFAGFDLTEVTPHYDSGLTAAQASYIILETIYSMESARQNPRA